MQGLPSPISLEASDSSGPHKMQNAVQRLGEAAESLLLDLEQEGGVELEATRE